MYFSGFVKENKICLLLNFYIINSTACASSSAALAGTLAPGNKVYIYNSATCIIQKFIYSINPYEFRLNDVSNGIILFKS